MRRETNREVDSAITARHPRSDSWVGHKGALPVASSSDLDKAIRPNQLEKGLANQREQLDRDLE